MPLRMELPGPSAEGARRLERWLRTLPGAVFGLFWGWTGWPAVDTRYIWPATAPTSTVANAAATTLPTLDIVVCERAREESSDCAGPQRMAGLPLQDNIKNVMPEDILYHRRDDFG